jgi:hypothetical protein
VRRELERIDVPGEHEARVRTWNVVSGAFEERQPTPPERHRLRLAVAIAIVAALVAAALSPPGRAVLDEIREAVGVEHAQPALFSLPAPGRLLVASNDGVWVVQQDGSKRLLGDYQEASWSPFGRFVVASKPNELVALEPDGGVRWSLARPQVISPRWGGTATDTRIAYVSSFDLRVVAGDGTGDRRIAPRGGDLAWRPGAEHVLGWLRVPGLRLRNVDTLRTSDIPIARRAGQADLSWSPDGRRALVVYASGLDLVEVPSGVVQRITIPGNSVVAAAFAPDGRHIAVLEYSRVLLLDAKRPRAKPHQLFAGAGPFLDLAWSPDSEWLLLDWPVADQWVFVRVDGGRIRAVGNVSEQFGSFPAVEGWCCSP